MQVTGKLNTPDPKEELPSEDCKERAIQNMNVLADVCLRRETEK